MTSKLNFIRGACHVFNATPNTVLAAVTGGHTVHPETASQIATLAEKSCNASRQEWKAFADHVAASPIVGEILWSMVSGAEIGTTQPTKGKDDETQQTH